MDLADRASRLLALLLAAALPPLVAYSIIQTALPDWVASVGTGTSLLIVGAAALGWAILVAVFGSRLLAGDVQQVVELTERGGPVRGETDDARSEAGEPTAAERRVTAALNERNRQIAILAEQFGAAPITASPAGTLTHLVALTRELTADPTWELAILRSDDPVALAPGVYDDGSGGRPLPLTEFHGWASVTGQGGDPETGPGARLAVGPWGGFMLIDVRAGELANGLLIAPWEGRTEPSPAELNLDGLIGRHAGTAVEHALLYHRLRQQTDELNRMATVQADFLRSVTHDLQTPLTTIRALSAEIRAVPRLPAQAKEDVSTIEEQADRLRRMVGQLLIASRIEAGAVTPRQDVLRWEPIIERTWRALRPASHVLHLDAEPMAVIGDADRLEQVLWALLDNAVKYSDPGSVIDVTVRGRPRRVADDGLSPDAQTSELVADLTVADRGIGIPPEIQERVFDQFYRGSAARERVPDGSGIGLYAAAGLVSAMGGGVRVQAVEGSGTTITVSLPGESVNEPDR